MEVTSEIFDPSLLPRKHDTIICSLMRSHRPVPYCNLNDCKISPGVAGKGKTKLTSSYPQRSGIHVLPNTTSIDYQSNSQTSQPALQSWWKFQPLLPAEKPKEIYSGPCLPRVHGLILFSSTSVPSWKSLLCHCLRTAVLFHLNVNEFLQIWSAVPVSLLLLCMWQKHNLKIQAENIHMLLNLFSILQWAVSYWKLLCVTKKKDRLQQYLIQTCSIILSNIANYLISADMPIKHTH